MTDCTFARLPPELIQSEGWRRPSLGRNASIEFRFAGKFFTANLCHVIRLELPCTFLAVFPLTSPPLVVLWFSLLYLMNSAAQKELATSEYWDSRYANEKSAKPEAEGEEYEWFRTFEKLRPFFERHLPAVDDAPKILQLGCGKSVGGVSIGSR